MLIFPASNEVAKINIEYSFANTFSHLRYYGSCQERFYLSVNLQKFSEGALLPWGVGVVVMGFGFWPEKIQR